MRTLDLVVKVSLTLLLEIVLGTGFIASAVAAEVAVDKIIVEPANPSVSTLCKLKVTLKNSGTQAVSYLKFNIKIAGMDVPLYKSHTYLIPVEPGTSGEVALFNFYSPSEAKPFDIQASLVEAQWVQVKKEGTSTTTTPSGPVAGLPTSTSLSVKMTAGK